MLARPELEPVSDRLVRRGPHLVGAPGLEQLALPEREPHVRPEVLVRRADEDVDVPGGDVDRPVRRVVDGVGPRERADGVRELDDPTNVGRRADRVRGDRKCDDARSVGELRREVVVVEREVVGHARDVNDEPEIVRQLEPRRDVRVVVERGHDDLVALAQRPREGAAQQEVERGHALPERGLSGRAAEERRGLLVRELDELGRPPARLVRRADVRVVLAQVARDRVDDLVGALRSTRPVEERESAVERGEARAYGGDVERGRAHRDLLAVDDPAMTRPRRQRVRDEAAVLGLGDEILQSCGLGRRGDVDLERRLDGDERVQPVLALRHRAVRASDALRVEPGATRRVVHARERAAHESGEHEVLRPPLDLSWKRAPAERAARVTRAVDRDVEVEHARAGGHAASLSARWRRPGCGLACGRMERLRTLSEAECYERCYGWRYTEDAVKLLPRGRTAAEPEDVGEKLRMLLELRLDAREPEAA